MKMEKSFLIALFLLAGFFIPTLSAQETVVLVYKNTNETTKRVFEYLKNGARSLGLNYKIAALPSEKTFSGTAAGVIILNIADKGLDPAIKSFLDRNPNLPRPVLLTMKPGSRDFTSLFIEKAKAPEGIDVVTSATAWSGWDNGNQTMHETWMKKAFALISQKQG